MKLAICLADPRVCDGSRASILALPFGESEKERLLAMKNPVAGRQSLCALQALRTLLEREGASPCPILREASGKPRFTKDVPYHFSLSHTVSLAAAALATSPLGIDVESVRGNGREGDIASRFFTAEEQRLWGAEPTTEQFYILWTKKEAAAKLDGGGLLGERDGDCHTRTFRLSRGEEILFLSLAAKEPIRSIRWIFQEKELTIDELPN